MSGSTRVGRGLLLAVVFALAASPLAWAADYTWTQGSGSDYLWTNAANWGGLPPGPGTPAIFEQAGQGGAVLLNGSQTIDTLQFSNIATGGHVLAGSGSTDTLTAATIDQQVSVAVGVTNEIQSLVAGGGGGGGALAINVASGTLKISGLVTAAVTGTVDGTLRLNNIGNDATMTGTITVNNGGLLHGDGGGSLGTALIVLKPNSTLRLDGVTWALTQGLHLEMYAGGHGTGGAIAGDHGTGWDAMTPNATATVPNIDYPFGDVEQIDGGWDPNNPNGPSIWAPYNDGFNQTAYLSCRTSGYLKITIAGDYRFWSGSDDGSRFWLKDGGGTWQLVVNNNWDQGYPGNGPLAASAIHLDAGLYEIVHGFYQGGGGWGTELHWDGGTGSWVGGDARNHGNLLPNGVFYTGGPVGNKTFNNTVCLCGDPTIDINGVVEVTALDVPDPSTLNVVKTTPPDPVFAYPSSLRFGSTTLGADLVINNVPEVPTALGALNDLGTARTLTKQGLGTVILDKDATSFVGGTITQAGTLDITAKAVGQGTITVAGGTTLLREKLITSVVSGWTTKGYKGRGWTEADLGAPDNQVDGVDQTAKADWEVINGLTVSQSGSQNYRRDLAVTDSGWSYWDNFVMSWTATLNVPTDGTYHLGIWGDDEHGYKLDGTWYWDGERDHTLTAGDHTIEVRFHEGGGDQWVHFHVKEGPGNSGNWRYVGETYANGLTVSTIGLTADTLFGNDVILATPFADANVAVHGRADMGKLTVPADINQFNVLDAGTDTLQGRPAPKKLTFTQTRLDGNLNIRSDVETVLGPLDDAVAPKTLAVKAGAGFVTVDQAPISLVAGTQVQVDGGNLRYKVGALTQAGYIAPIALNGGHMALVDDSVITIQPGGLNGDYYQPDGGQLVTWHYDNNNWGTYYGSRYDPVINFDFSGNAAHRLPGMGNDNFAVKWTGYMLLDGTSTVLGTSSDDGSIVWIDINKDGDFNDAGERVVFNDYWQGETYRSGTVNVPAPGLYPILIGFDQGGGGAQMRFWYDSPRVIVDFAHLYSPITTPVINFGNNVALTASSIISLTGSADMGKLTVTGDGTVLTAQSDGLGISKANILRFTGTTYTQAFGVNVDPGVAVMLGSLNDQGLDPDVIKTGAGDLVLDYTDPGASAAVTTFKNQGGRIVGVAINGGSDPFGGAVLESDAGNGGWVLNSKAGDVTFDNTIDIQADTLLEARKLYTGVDTGREVELSGDITVNANLTMMVRDGYRFRISGTVGGSGQISLPYINKNWRVGTVDTLHDTVNLVIDGSTSGLVYNIGQNNEVTAASATALGPGTQVEINGDGHLDIQVAQNNFPWVHVKTLASLGGDVTNAQYSGGGQNVLFDDRAILANSAGPLPTVGDMGGQSYILRGILAMNEDVPDRTFGFGSAETPYKGVAFSNFFSDPGAFKGVLTMAGDASSFEIALRRDQQFGDATGFARINATSPQAQINVTGPGCMTISGGPDNGIRGTARIFNRIGNSDDPTDYETALTGNTRSSYLLRLASASAINIYRTFNVERGLVDITNSAALALAAKDPDTLDPDPGSEGTLNLNGGATLWTVNQQMQPATGTINVNPDGMVRVVRWNPGGGLADQYTTTGGANWNFEDGSWVFTRIGLNTSYNELWKYSGPNSANLPTDKSVNIITSGGDWMIFDGGLPLGNGALLTSPWNENARIWHNNNYAGNAIKAQLGALYVRIGAPQGDRWFWIDTDVNLDRGDGSYADLVIGDAAANKYWLPKGRDDSTDFEPRSLTGNVIFLDGRYDTGAVTVAGGYLRMLHPWDDSRVNVDLRGIRGTITVNAGAVLEYRGFRPHKDYGDDWRGTGPIREGILGTAEGDGIAIQKGGMVQIWPKNPLNNQWSQWNEPITFLGSGTGRSEFYLEQTWGNEWSDGYVWPDVTAENGANFRININNIQTDWRAFRMDLAMGGNATMDQQDAWRHDVAIRDITDLTGETPTLRITGNRHVTLMGRTDVNIVAARTTSGDRGVRLEARDVGQWYGGQFDLNGHVLTYEGADTDDYTWNEVYCDPGQGTIRMTDSGAGWGWVTLLNSYQGSAGPAGWGENTTIELGGKRYLRMVMDRPDGGSTWYDRYTGPVNVIHTEGQAYDAAIMGEIWNYGRGGAVVAGFTNVNLPDGTILMMGKGGGDWNEGGGGVDFRLDLNLAGNATVVGNDGDWGRGGGNHWWGDNGAGTIGDVTGLGNDKSLLTLKSNLAGGQNGDRFFRLRGKLTNADIRVEGRSLWSIDGNCDLNGNILDLAATRDDTNIWVDPAPTAAGGIIKIHGPLWGHLRLHTGNWGGGETETSWGQNLIIEATEGHYMGIMAAGNDGHINNYAGKVKVSITAGSRRNDWGIDYDAEVSSADWDGGSGTRYGRYAHIEMAGGDTGLRLNGWSGPVKTLANIDLKGSQAHVIMYDAGTDNPAAKRYYIESVNGDPLNPGRTLRLIGDWVYINTSITGGANVETWDTGGVVKLGGIRVGEQSALTPGFNMTADATLTIARTGDWDMGWGWSSWPVEAQADCNPQDGTIRLVGWNDGGTRRGGNLELRRASAGGEALASGVKVEISNNRFLCGFVSNGGTQEINGEAKILDTGTLAARNAGGGGGWVQFTNVRTAPFSTLNLAPNFRDAGAGVAIGRAGDPSTGLFMEGDTTINGASEWTVIHGIHGASYHDLTINGGGNGTTIDGPVQANNVKITGTVNLGNGASADMTGHVEMSQGSKFKLNPGVGNSITFAPQDGVINNGEVVAVAGTTDLGNALIRSTIDRSSSYVGGLLEGRILGNWWDTTTPNPGTVLDTGGNPLPGRGGVQLGPIMGNTVGNDNPGDSTQPWYNNTTYVYNGDILFDNGDGVIDPGLAVDMSFGKNFDDNVLIIIDGQQLMNDTRWNTPMGVTMNRPEGWYPLELRFGQGGGGAGPVGGPVGFGFKRDNTSGDPLPDGNIANLGYVAPLDDGTMNLFRYSASSYNIGSITVNADSTLLTGGFRNIGNVNINDNGKLILKAGVGAVGEAYGGSIDAAGGAQLDINDGKVILHYAAGASPIDAVQALVASGFNGYQWDGPGIMSTVANEDYLDGDPTYKAVGYLDNANWGYWEFGGVTDLTGNEILIALTYYGDADLTGDVTIDDYSMWENGFLNGLTYWENGDFDNSGDITIDDYSLWEASFLAGLPPIGSGGGGIAGLQAVPEPATLGLLGIGLAAMALARKRRK